MERNKQNKVVYLITALLRGGSTIVTLRVARYLLDTKGLEPIFYCVDKGYDESLLPEFGFDRDATIVYDAPELGVEGAGERNVSYLSEILSQEKPIAFVDALNSNTLGLYGVIRRMNIPIVKWWHTMPFFISKLHMSKWELKARESFINKLWYLFGASWQLRGFNKSEGASLYQYISSADLFFVLCEGYKKDLIKALKLSDQEARKLRPMINPIEVYSSVDLGRKECKIVNVGRLELLCKRYDRFVEVWKYAHKRLPDWSFDIYGRDRDGCDVAHLEALIRESGLPRIRYCGVAYQPSEVYDLASVFLFTSAYEGWPVTLMEAQRQGVVPLALNCCKGVEEIIAGERGDLEAGVLISEPFDARRFADRLVELCLDDARRQRLQKNCLDRILGYQPEVNEASWQAFFRLIGMEE